MDKEGMFAVRAYLTDVLEHVENNLGAFKSDHVDPSSLDTVNVHATEYRQRFQGLAWARLAMTMEVFRPFILPSVRPLTLVRLEVRSLGQ